MVVYFFFIRLRIQKRWTTDAPLFPKLYVYSGSFFIQKVASPIKYVFINSDLFVYIMYKDSWITDLDFLEIVICNDLRLHIWNLAHSIINRTVYRQKNGLKFFFDTAQTTTTQDGLTTIFSTCNYSVQCECSVITTHPPSLASVLKVLNRWVFWSSLKRYKKRCSKMDSEIMLMHTMSNEHECISNKKKYF